ncbi:MAG: hypothetical protein ABF785_02385 [Acetobacter papayae]
MKTRKHAFPYREPGAVDNPSRIATEETVNVQGRIFVMVWR